MELIPIDGGEGESGGQTLRTALALSAASGRGFRMDRIRAKRLQPGLRPQHVAAVRAAALCCGADVHGAFDGSPDLRFTPGAASAGSYSFDIGATGATTLVLQTVAPILALAGAESRVAVCGGTHVPRSPAYPFLERHWAEFVARLGLRLRPRLARSGFAPKGEGRVECEIEPWDAPATLDLTQRGAFRAVRGVAGSARRKGDVAKRAVAAAGALLWETRRIEAEWEIEELDAASPGSFFQIEAVFENGRGAFCVLGDRGASPEQTGERAARRVLRFVEDETAAVDPWLADQLALPLALARGGGRVTTSDVTSHLLTAASVLSAFGVPVAIEGRKGGPGVLEVGPWKRLA